MPRPSLLRRLLPWLGVLLLAGYCTLGISRVRFEVDVTRLLPADLPETTGARLYMQHFLRPSQILLLIESASSTQAEAAAARVASALASMDGAIARVTWQRADEDNSSWPELAAWMLLNQSETAWMEIEHRLARDRIASTLEDYIETLATSPFMQEGLAGYDPLGLVSPLLEAIGSTVRDASEFASADGKLRVLYVDLRAASHDYRAIAGQLQAIRRTAEQAAGSGAILRLTGEPAFLAEISLNMERDMKRSALTTLLLTTLLVWVFFRQLRLLPLLALCLGLIFALTLATCGLLTGSLTALTIGFGSILIGLSADYGVLVFQARRRSGADARTAARMAAPGILWAMTTTSTVFLALLPLGFPGLSDLGLLVACGVLIGAAVMLFVLPPLLERLGGAVIPGAQPLPGSAGAWRSGGALALGLLLLCAAGLAARGLPKVDAASGSIRPRNSEAYAAMETLEAALGGGQNALGLLVSADHTRDMPARLAAARAALDTLRQRGLILSHALPDIMWPDAARRQAALQGPAARLLAEEPWLRAAVEAAGFTGDAWSLTGSIFAHWRAWMTAGIPDLPADQDARWLVERVLSLPAGGGGALLGAVQAAPATGLAALVDQLPEGCHLVGGNLLTQTLDRYLNRGFKGITFLFASLTLLLLAIALRAWRPWLLAALCLAVSYAALLGLMSWLDLRWNAFTLPALLLSLGTGSDYFIHLILRLQAGERSTDVRAALAPALIVCAGSSILGFGSLLTASSAGLASMGLVCAAALALNLISALLVMPWLWDCQRKAKPDMR